jgi:hypothetical protein
MAEHRWFQPVDPNAERCEFELCTRHDASMAQMEADIARPVDALLAVGWLTDEIVGSGSVVEVTFAGDSGMRTTSESPPHPCPNSSARNPSVPTKRRPPAANSMCLHHPVERHTDRARAIARRQGTLRPGAR